MSFRRFYCIEECPVASTMRQSVKLILLAVVFCAYCTKAQDAEPTEHDSEAESTVNLSEEVYQNATNQLDTKRAGRIFATTTIADYPYVVTVMVIVDKGEIFYRTGVIISDTHVLTALIDSSDFYGKQIKNVAIRVGSDYHDKGGFTFENAEYKNHDLWTRNSKENFVCIVTIKDSFSKKANVKPIAVETSVIPVTPTTPSCIMLGWIEHPVTAFTVLSRVDFKLSTEADCTIFFQGSIPATLQCAESGLSYICQSAGSPLVCNNRVYGIFHPTCTASMTSYTNLPSTAIKTFLSPFLPVKKIFNCPCNTC
ncbi:trypsin delta-like [Anopheles albimanus]|uniref:trypsin delta-like n=1 Tax=Anopheles albimanus TaxID=7167 RepID=UPI001640F79B|nr:trypsin delta-like [Anopheles albimanus]XP_035791519.1 trypsin delta-like [Anopheles albimanus]